MRGGLTTLPVLTLLAGLNALGQAVSPESLVVGLPQSFEPNRGQADRRVEYLAHGPGYSLSLARGEALLNLTDEGGPRRRAKSAAVRVKVLGSDRRVTGYPSDLQTGKSNYFIGNNPKLWQRDLPHYGRVEYSGIYPGIDLAYYGAGQQLEYDFVVRPQAQPRKIRLEFDGADQLSIDPSGDLVLAVGGSQIRERKPVAYQESEGERRAVEARYVLLGKKQVGFEVGSYDDTMPLVIDPVLVYSTYLGSADNDLAYRVVLDAAGNSYYGGMSKNTMLAGNAIGSTTKSTHMIAKVSPSGVLLYTAFIGGTADQTGIDGLDVDGSGNVYATGQTWSADFPRVNDPRNSSWAGGQNDVFVLELNSTGNALVFSTLLGGNNNEYSVGLRLDSGGNIYVVGNTQSTNFPTTPGAYQTTLAGGKDAFLTKLAPGGTSLVYSTYFGGNSGDDSNDITVDATGNAYIYGDTGSVNFPSLNAFQPTYCGGTAMPTYGHGWLSKFSPSGSLVYSTFVCGSQLGFDTVRGAAVDSSGDLIITGGTSSTTFPITSGAIQKTYAGTILSGGGDAFVMKLSPSGGLLYSSYLGGSDNDGARDVVIDAEGNWYITGDTASTNFPMANPLQSANGGSYDAFLTKINASGSAILFSTYLGGNQSDQGNDIAVDADGRAYIAGQTASTNFPTKNPIQAAYGGGTNDAFVAIVATCDFTFSTPGTAMANGDSGSISITTTPECGWTAASKSTWITLTSSASGVGTGAVSYSVVANTGGPRSGTLTIGGIAVPISQQGIVQSDFNGDGIPDLVWQNDSTRQASVWYMGGSGGSALQSWNWISSAGVPGWHVAATADFNRDGVPDLVWQNDAMRQVSVWYMGGSGGATMQSWSWISSAGVQGWRVVAAADFNKDSVPDLVWQNDTTRQVSVWYMGGSGGAALQSWSTFNGVPGWSVVN